MCQPYLAVERVPSRRQTAGHHEVPQEATRACGTSPQPSPHGVVVQATAAEQREPTARVRHPKRRERALNHLQHHLDRDPMPKPEREDWHRCGMARPVRGQLLPLPTRLAPMGNISGSQPQ